MRLIPYFCLIPFSAFAQPFGQMDNSDGIFDSGKGGMAIPQVGIMPDGMVLPQVGVGNSGGFPKPIPMNDPIEASELVCNEPRCEEDPTMEGCLCEYLSQ